MRPPVLAFTLTLASVVGYVRRVRPWVLTWGASRDEASARLPGDELLEDADGIATRAVTIDAPAGAVWPWIAQMGPAPRGGAYTYDWIENLLGLDMHSADVLLPEFQHPRVGEVFALGANRMRVERVEPGRVLSWRSQDGNWVWSFVLREQDGRTRLISRNRYRLPTPVARIGMLPMEPASLVMERKMLHGIRERAQRLAREAPEGAPRLRAVPRPQADEDISGPPAGSRPVGTSAARPRITGPRPAPTPGLGPSGRR